MERIRGAVLLISSTDDGQWPSTAMAEQIMARLRAHGFRCPYTHIANEGAGHPMGWPYLSVVIPDTPNPATGRRNENGGPPVATQRARERAWAAMLEFFEANLRR
ncbi:MAG TPA: acyl-CoA thioester hydrolase/BAAT C-terminal domain-containing protein [Gemmatimonadaceae bacterium]|nr:acyl-CoA thioester hydrolase/BAAT C-terminal domain-containing protein [Gemmatimonadaceae bacterium]